MKKLILALMVISSPAYAIKYYRTVAGVATTINEEVFDTCPIKIYRKSGARELSKKNKKAFVRASLTAKAVNDLDAARKKLLLADDHCTYGQDSDVF